jgi:hypothetical protein
MPIKADVSISLRISEYSLTEIVGYFLPNDEVRVHSLFLAMNA